jgi:hypothetical protein
VVALPQLSYLGDGTCDPECDNARHCQVTRAPTICLACPTSAIETLTRLMAKAPMLRPCSGFLPQDGGDCVFDADGALALAPSYEPRTWNEAARQPPNPRCICWAQWNDTNIGGACAREQVGC